MELGVDKISLVKVCIAMKILIKSVNEPGGQWDQS